MPYIEVDQLNENNEIHYCKLIDEIYKFTILGIYTATAPLMGQVMSKIKTF